MKKDIVVVVITIIISNFFLFNGWIDRYLGMMIQGFFGGFLGVCLSENFIPDKRLGFSRVGGSGRLLCARENWFSGCFFFSSFSL